MAEILWLGDADWWPVPPIPEHPQFLMALTEEAVLDVAHRTTALQKNSVTSAIATVSRLAMRVALAATGLNPKWHPVNIPSGVVKASASCMNSGVRFFSNTDYTKNLAKYAPELAEFGVWEELVLGNSIEVDGAVINGKVYFFFAIEQHWNYSCTSILEYQRLSDFPIGLEKAVTTAIKAIGINNSAFCAELKYTPQCNWKLIEIHSRLGEDKNLSKIIWNTDPIEQIEGWIEEQMLNNW